MFVLVYRCFYDLFLVSSRHFFVSIMINNTHLIPHICIINTIESHTVFSTLSMLVVIIYNCKLENWYLISIMYTAVILYILHIYGTILHTFMQYCSCGRCIYCMNFTYNTSYYFNQWKHELFIQMQHRLCRIIVSIWYDIKPHYNVFE